MTAPTAPVMVTMAHVRAAGLCAPGVRRFAAQFDRAVFRRFCHEGLPVDEVEALGGPFALRVAAIAREEASRG